MVAHRLSTIVMADEIIVLGKDGADGTTSIIVERGTHDELLAQDGQYASMWETQTSTTARGDGVCDNSEEDSDGESSCGCCGGEREEVMRALRSGCADGCCGH